MSRLLVSWIATTRDFLKNEQGAFGGINPLGPTSNFHQHYFEAEKLEQHILLYSDARQENHATHLVAHLRREYPGRAISAELLPLTDIIDLEEVKTKVETWLLAHREHELAIFFSPGASIMQVAWYICHTTLNLRTRLLQTRDAKFVKDGWQGLVEIVVERSQAPVTAIIGQQLLDEPKAQYSSGAGHLLTPTLRAVYRRAYLVAKTDDVTVLIRGESGTGKEQLARYVHEESARAGQPYLVLNCAALTDSVLESRLFGHKKGAFTGADRDAKGLFELADGGTIFLDEIGDISPAVQMALLRVLQEKEIQPLGGSPRKVDVRVVAATNAALEECCRQGRFRWDLYYRLAVAELELPALRNWPLPEREALLDHLLENRRQALKRPTPLRLAAATRQLLLGHTYQGNIRELENLLTTVYVFTEGQELVQPADLPRRLREPAPAGHSLRLADVEREHLLRVMALKNNVVRQAALALAIDERTLAAKLNKYKQELG
ncbi:sigma 54-interacting transcriptional regulator [Hymenobacter sp. DG25B]|uniref:sigma 54-interacting transcriptional regulator n=1 Tax=Hymenobacter sp. DG25B TaxID=1385664 RepID=UPI0006938710|nr:sigma 54-interacting transcriptional regulator [Hymenobacter sp. DG25B]